MEEIPRKGWCVRKEADDPTVSGTRVYLDGKLVGGIQKLSIEVDAVRMVPVLKLEIVAFQGLVWNTSFGELPHRPGEPLPEPEVFRSTSTPEEILRDIVAKGGDPKPDEVL